MSQPTELPVCCFAAAEDWASWLAAHSHDPGVWIKFAKKASGVPSITYAQALEEALCYGWIDGQLKPFDETYYLQRFTPRGLRSTWSVRNRDIVERLISEGRMQPAGQYEIDRAKADGRWQAAYASPRNAQLPQDFLDALAKNKPAQTFFETLNKANCYAIYYRLHTAKKPETRHTRIIKIITMLAEGRKFH